VNIFHHRPHHRIIKNLTIPLIPSDSILHPQQNQKKPNTKKERSLLRIVEVAVNRFPLIASFANTVEEDNNPILLPYLKENDAP
jgi:hypothetical protein